MKKLALVVCVGSLLAFTSATPPISAQSPAPSDATAQSPAPARFEVVSVKASAPADPSNPATLIPQIAPAPDGSLRIANLPLRLLVRVAYNVDDENIIGGPEWQTSQRWDINARAEAGGPTGEDAMRERMRGLLADRFKVKTHTETREMNVSALVLANKDGKLGPNLKPSTADCSNQQEEAAKLAQEVQKNPANALALMQQVKCGVIPVPQVGTGGAPQIMIRGLGQDMTVAVKLIQQLLGKPVVDKTGLTGKYDFEMEMPLDPELLRRVAGQIGVNLPPGASNIPAYDGPALTTILKDRLGLTLDSQKAQVPVVVIDSAEMPAAD
ncbi:MAG TPA: TIGR03435 family protein [Vicinamibacterales bacterium]|nr:TIGR03435 family protein [Vicinamibacterales bacterium]